MFNILYEKEFLSIADDRSTEYLDIITENYCY